MVSSDQMNHEVTIAAPAKARVDKPQLWLSSERQKKFELLIDLIKTRQQMILLCGPEGIGKSTFLKRLAKSGDSQQIWHYFESHRTLNVSTIVTQLSSLLPEIDKSDSSSEDAGVVKQVVRQLRNLANHGQSVVLMLDDAGLLQAEVITRLFAFAEKCKGLQLILSITPDDLFIKRATDSVIDESYVVEIPLLTEKEVERYTLDYIQDNTSLLTIDTIDQGGIAEFYHQSQGLPGLVEQQLLTKYSKLATGTGEIKPTTVKSAAILVLIGVSIWAVLSYIGTMRNTQGSVNYIELTNAPPPVTDVDTTLQNSHSDTVGMSKDKHQQPSLLPTTEEILNATLADEAASFTEPVTTAVIDAQEDSSLDTRDTQKQTQSTTLDDRSVSGQQLLFQGAHGPKWVLAQNKDSYTLQLMASHEKNRLQESIDRIAVLRDQLAYYQMKRDGKNWYALVYGIYASADDAKVASKQLHGFPGKPFIQKIGKVQTRIHAFE